MERTGSCIDLGRAVFGYAPSTTHLADFDALTRLDGRAPRKVELVAGGESTRAAAHPATVYPVVVRYAAAMNAAMFGVPLPVT